MEYTIEHQLIVKMLTENTAKNDLDLLACIHADRFDDKNAEKVFSFALEHKKKYGVFPDMTIAGNRFPFFYEEFPQSDALPSQPLKWFCDEFRNKAMFDMIKFKMGDIQSMLEDDDPSKSEELLKEIINTAKVAQMDYKPSTGVTLNTSKQEFLADYLAGEANAMTGIPTGIDAVDYITKGIKPTDLWTILGYVNLGKTWSEVIIAANSYALGYKPLLITREMSAKQLLRRVYAAQLKIPFGGIINRNLPKDYFEKLEKFCNSAEDGTNDLIIEESNGGVSYIASLIEKHSPDLVLTDGAYLMGEDSKAQTGWEKIRDIWEDMKDLARATRVPNIATMQLKENKASLEGIAMAGYIRNACDVMWGMEQTDELKQQSQIMLKSLKQREAENTGCIYMNWDFSTMNTDVEYVTGITGYEEWKLARNSRKIGEKKEEIAEEKPKLKSKLGLRRKV